MTLRCYFPFKFSFCAGLAKPY